LSERPAVDDYPDTAGYGPVEPSHLAENVARSCANSFGEEPFGDRARFIEGECFWASTVKGDVRGDELWLVGRSRAKDARNGRIDGDQRHARNEAG